MIHILSIALIYCGTVFGAGFASGQEIVSFFSSHFLWGVVLSVFVGFLFSFFGYAVCSKAKEFGLNSAKEYFDFLFPKAVSGLLHFICMAFLVVSFCIMIAGCGTLFKEQFSLRPMIGSLFSLVICYKIIKNRVGGLARFNAVITPFMFLGVVALCCVVLTRTDVDFSLLEQGRPQKAAFSGALYLSYNLVSAAAVLAPSAAIAKSKRQAGLGGRFGRHFGGCAPCAAVFGFNTVSCVSHRTAPLFCADLRHASKTEAGLRRLALLCHAHHRRFFRCFGAGAG